MPELTHANSPQSLSLVLKNDGEELIRLSDEVDAFAERNELAEDARFGLQLCLEEAVMNIVNYGFDDMDEHDILIQLNMQNDGRTLLVSIVDDGTELSYLDEVDLELDSLLEDQALGGLGFHLMRQYSNELLRIISGYI